MRYYSGMTHYDTTGAAQAGASTGKLILVRHTLSEWNEKGIWSGITDVHLSEKGKKDCAFVAEALQKTGIPIDVAFYTEQIRTEQTLDGICAALGRTDIVRIREARFNERNYGEYTGMDKWKVKEQLGEEKFNRIRRGWDEPFPNGETLREVFGRVVPAYEERVLPLLREGKNVMIVGHGNGLRALMKHLDSLSDTEVEDLEMLMNQIVIYDIDRETGLKADSQVIYTAMTLTSQF